MCDCEAIICLNVVPAICADEITLRLTADETGTWLVFYEFNSRWFGVEVEVTNGQNIVLPYVFNNNYTHNIKFYNTDYELFNDTCYSLNTASLPANSTTAGGGNTYQDKTRDITLTFRDAPVLDNEIEVSNVITLALLETVNLRGYVLFNDVPQNRDKKGIILDQSAGTLTLPANYDPVDGDYITLLYNLP